MCCVWLGDIYSIQAPRPRPMKETLYSRHHSTVLPRLGTSRKETTRSYTRGVFCYSATRNHQSTEGASQLRSGHCHLLQDYKHRLLGEPSDMCTDCGASP